MPATRDSGLGALARTILNVIAAELLSGSPTVEVYILGSDGNPLLWPPGSPALSPAVDEVVERWSHERGAPDRTEVVSDGEATAVVHVRALGSAGFRCAVLVETLAPDLPAVTAL